MADTGISSSSLSLILLLISLSIIAVHSVVNATVPAVFIFGDSTADVGTNNYLDTWVKANHPHYGIDFPGSIPTGRFSNGLNSADFLAQQMGFEMSPPAFLSLVQGDSPLNETIAKGVNFASAGAGILDLTGVHMIEINSLDDQIDQFAIVRENLIKLLNLEETDSMLSKSPFLISIGSNDVFQHFYGSYNVSEDQQRFINRLKRRYEEHLRRLYSLGARKFGLISIPPVGCCPSKRTSNDVLGGCTETYNDYAREFHSTIGDLMSNLSSELEGMKYSIGNAYEMVMDILHAVPPRFKELTSACCVSTILNGYGPCNRWSDLCLNREDYLFWDLYHPTEAAAKLGAETLYDGSLQFVAPINFRQLAEDGN